MKTPRNPFICDYPEVDRSLIDKDLELQVSTAREVVFWDALREKQAKTRQPLAAVTLVHYEEPVRIAIEAQAHLIAAEDQNVKEVKIQV